MDAFTAPIILALIAALLFWTYLVTLIAPRRWGLVQAREALFGAFLNVLLAAIVTSVLATVAVSILRMMA